MEKIKALDFFLNAYPTYPTMFVSNNPEMKSNITTAEDINNALPNVKFFVLSKGVVNKVLEKINSTVINFEDFKKGIEEINYEIESLDLPFKDCLIVGDNTTNLFSSREKGKFFSVYAILVREIAPDFYRFYTMFSNNWDGLPEGFIVSDSKCDPLSIFPYLKTLFKELKKETVIIASKETDIKLRIGKNKKRLDIKNIISINLNKEIKKSNSENSVEVERANRWWVMGHWRRLLNTKGNAVDFRRLGHDREGNCIVAGYTWVNAYIKGQKNKPIKESIRLLKYA